jgi:hypothetical protein
MSNANKFDMRKEDLMSELIKIRKEREDLMEAEHKVMFELDLFQRKNSIDDDGASDAESALTVYPPCQECGNYCECIECPCCMQHKAGAVCVCDPKRGRSCGSGNMCAFCTFCFKGKEGDESDQDH